MEEEQLPEEYMLWLETLVVNQSGFVPYTDRPIQELGIENKQNMNKKMIEFLRRSRKGEEREPERERCYRHMINERMRRENQKQSYLALHNLLPLGTKSDKNSIIQMAAKKIQEMERYKEELERRNRAIELNLAAGKEERKEGGGNMIRFKVAVATPTSSSSSSSSSGIDTMIEVVKCLKDMGLITTSIHSTFCDFEFSTDLEIEAQNGTKEEVEKAVQRRLVEVEVERKRRFFFQEGGCEELKKVFP